MALTKYYNPSPAITGKVALDAGRGFYNQRRDEMLERRRQMQAQHALSRDSAMLDFYLDRERLRAQLAAQERAQAMDLMRMQSQAALQWQMAQAEHQLAQEKMLADMGLRAAMQQQDLGVRQLLGAQELDQERALSEMRLGQQQDQWMQQRDYIWQQDSAEQQEQQVNYLLAEMAKNQQYMTPEGKRLYADLTGKLRAVQRQRGTVRPQQYVELLSQWQQEYEQSGLQNHIIPPLSLEDEWKQRAIDLGGGRYVVKQANGDWREFAPPKQPEPPSDPNRPLGERLRERWSDPVNFQKDWGASLERLQMGDPTKQFTPEAIQAEMMRFAQQQEQVLRELGQMGGAAPPAAPGMPMAGQPQLSPEAEMQKRMEAVQTAAPEQLGAAFQRGGVGGVIGGMGDVLNQGRFNVVPGAMTEQAKREWTPEALMQRIAEIEQTPEYQQLQQASEMIGLSLKPTELFKTEAIREALAAGSTDPVLDIVRLNLQLLVPHRPKSKQEFDALASGQLFIDPTGKLRRKP